MATTSISATPANTTQHHRRNSSHSHSRTRPIPTRPTTPLRPPSRTSLRTSQNTPSTAGHTLKDGGGGGDGGLNTVRDFPLNALEPAFAELSDGMADLEANFMHLQLLNESLARFNENFGAFLYGMNMSAFCVDFPEAPISHSFARHKDTMPHPGDVHPPPQSPYTGARHDVEATFLTTDTTFVDNPPPTVARPAAGKFSSVPPSSASAASVRRGASTPRGGRTRGAGAAGASTAGKGGNVGRGGASARGGSGVGRSAGSGIARGVRGRGGRV